MALCVFSHEGRILVDQTFDHSSRDFFCRPLGGGVEFGETSRQAIEREVREELNAEIVDVRLLGILENIFTCEGDQGHEVVFVYDARFKENSLYSQQSLTAYEQDNDTRFTAHWRSLSEIESEGVRLVPEGLANLLSSK